jgi:CspA family cold shock protein
MTPARVFGTVKWYNRVRGFGFITSDSGADIFVVHSGINSKGHPKLRAGDRVAYNVVDGPKGPLATGVSRVYDVIS